MGGTSVELKCVAGDIYADCGALGTEGPSGFPETMFVLFGVVEAEG